MVYSDFSIDMLKERLLTKSMQDRTPKKYAGDMFEAYEVIRQLQREIKKLKKEQNNEKEVAQV